MWTDYTTVFAIQCTCTFAPKCCTIKENCTRFLTFPKNKNHHHGTRYINICIIVIKKTQHALKSKISNSAITILHNDTELELVTFPGISITEIMHHHKGGKFGRKETWCLTSTETIRLIMDGEKGGGGRYGDGEEGDYIPNTTLSPPE